MQQSPHAFQAATQLHQAGKLEDAEKAYRQIISENPDFAPAWQLAGVLAMQQQRFGDAVECLTKAAALGPAADAHCNLGEALRAMNRFEEAIAQYNRSIQLNPNYSVAYSNLGTALNELGRHAEALPHLERALSLAPENVNTLYHAGIALEKLGQRDASIARWEQALRLHPGNPLVTNALALALAHSGQSNRAVELLRPLTHRYPNFAEAHANLAFALMLTPGPSSFEAAKAYERAATLRPDVAEYFVRACGGYYLCRNFDQALQVCQRGISRHPRLHFDRGIVLLAMGAYDEGFAEYEWRSHIPHIAARARTFDCPMWDGSDPAGRTILIHSEQGFGDMVQFSRYIPMVVQAGATVIVEVAPEVRELLSSVAPGARFRSVPPRTPDYDLHVPLLSLPRIFKTTLANLPATVPYLRADDLRIARWRSVVEPAALGLKVGLVWGGRSAPDPRRSIPLKQLAPLAAVPSVTWFSLQTDEPRAEMNDATELRLIDIGKDLKNFSDTAAVLANLDLLVTIDTAIAHLGGAMAVPTMTLLPFAPDWRWGTEGDSTPWYPGMRLYRQQCSGDWSAPVRVLCEAITACAARG